MAELYPGWQRVSTSVKQRRKYVLRIFLDGTQQCSCRAGRMAAPLLPVLKRAKFHVNDLRKLGLREFGKRADAFYLLRRNVGLARRSSLASTDFIHLGDALKQVFEKFFFHGYLHCSITCLNPFFCEIAASSPTHCRDTAQR